MRKIKTDKKELEKKRKQITKYYQEMLHLREDLHDMEGALRLAKKIYELRPDNQEIMEGVAATYITHSDSVASSDELVKYLEDNFPQTSHTLYLRTCVCDSKAEYGKAIKTGEKGLQIFDEKKDNILTKMLLHNILGHVYRYAGLAEEATKHYELSAKIVAKQQINKVYLDTMKRIRPDDYSNFLFSAHNLNWSREKIFEETCGFNDLFKDLVPYSHDPKTHPRHKKIRIGYVSADFRMHVVSFFVYCMIMYYDKTRFELYIYAKNKEDLITKEFRDNVDAYRNVLYLDHKEVAKIIKDDELDILFDFSGHTANNFLAVLAYKPAPIQISGIGWFGSTGLKAVDYFLVDKYTDPEGLNENFFTEKLLRLQHSHFCYMWHSAPTVVTPAPCTSRGYVTFVSFNNFTKVTDEIIRLWTRIVLAVPKSRLYLKGKVFRDPYSIELALKRFREAGFPMSQLDAEQDEYAFLEKYKKTDIALDTFPYPGGATTCDALYSGVPVITLVGERHNSRFGYSLLKNAGFEELCAFSEEEYVQKAIELANDWDRIRDYHLTIRRKMEQSNIMNDVVYMGEIEQAYEKIYNSWINGEGLPDFPETIEPIDEETAEYYYKRALEYIGFERGFSDGEIKEKTNIKRALYYLMLASEKDKKHDAEIYLLMAACRQELQDYVRAYEDIQKVGEIISSPEHVDGDFSKKFLQQYYERRGKLALINGNPIEAANSYDHAAEVAEVKKDRFRFCSSALLCLHFLDIPSEDLAASHFEFQSLLDDIKPYTEYHDRKPILRGEARIKIGYLSPDFRKHAVFPFAFGLISCHNKKYFEVTCYSLNDKDDGYKDLYKKFAEHFEDVSKMNYEEIAKKIHDDDIDILIDLAGHSAGNALPVLAYRPAPIQISGIGYMSTTGMKTVDYFITDEIVDPPGEHEKYFTEKLLYMPSQFCYAAQGDLVVPDCAPCKKREYVVFGTICRYSKISDDMLNIWKEILEKVPLSVLLMRAEEFESLSTIDQAYERLKKIGFNLDRVLFRPAVENYMTELLKVDVLLDAYPYVGGSTTCDALYMGVPVVTFYGERRSTRFGLSILENIGLGELAVNNVEDYINRAVSLVKDVETLDMLHKNIRNMMENSEALSPVHYTKLFEQKLERIFRVGKDDDDD